jgi:hypothetical protein
VVRSYLLVPIALLALLAVEGCKKKATTAASCASTACATGFDCVQTADGALCLKPCPCGSEQACVDSYCRDRCADDGECGSDQHCEGTRGVCRSDAPSSGTIGATCTSTAECSSGEADCYEDFDGFPAGTCSSDCNAATGCPDDGVCIVTNVSGDGRCFAGCSTDANCRDGYNCIARDGTSPVCLPPCTMWNTCYTGEHCDSASGRCFPAKTVGGGEAGVVSTINVGTFSGTESGGPEGDFTIPENLVSVMLVGQSDNPSAQVALATMGGPDQQLFDIRTPYSWPLQVYPYGEGAAAVLIPNSPSFHLAPGDYYGSFYSSPDSSIAVSLVTKTASGPLTGGKIDLNLWFATSHLSATSAPGNEYLQEVLAEVRRRWAAAGLAMGEVSYFDVPDGESYRHITEDDVGTLCRTSSGAAADRLNWYFVDSIDSAQRYGTTLGIASGIPGAPIRGSGISGVVISLVDWGNRPKTLAATTVHETGHWLGLFHTSERDGLHFDPLDDTPRCPIERDHDGNGLVEAWECFFQDANNVMFWLSDTGGQPQDHWSDGQAFVMVRHPAVH